MFSEKELQMVVSGVSAGINVKDLMEHTKYIDYRSGSKTIKLFWEIMRDWDDEMREALLRFVEIDLFNEMLLVGVF